MGDFILTVAAVFIMAVTLGAAWLPKQFGVALRCWYDDFMKGWNQDG